MKKICLLTASLLVTFCSFGQTTNVVWAENLKYSTPYNDSYSNDLVIDNAGNYYVTGDFEYVLDMDPGAGTSTISSVGMSDAFIAKYSSNGNLIWVKSIGTAGGPDGGIALHLVNNTLYVVGSFWDPTIDLDPGPSTYTVAGSSSGVLSGFVMTLDANGTFQSGFSIPQCPVFAVNTDNSGNIYIGGQFMGSVDLDPGPGVYPKSSVTSSGVYTWDMYYGKYSASGNMVWATTKGSSGSEKTNGISIDPVTGDIAVAATYNGIYMARTNSSGTIIKELNIGTGLASDAMFDNSGNLYFAGVYSTNADFDWNAASTYTLPANSTAQGFIIKYTPSNTFSWGKQIPLVNSINYATSPAINLDNNSDILMTDREANAASASWLVFMKLDKSSGSIIWRNDLTSVCYNGNNRNEGTAIAYSPLDQTVLVTGTIGGSSSGSSTPCSFDADPGSGVYTLTAGVGNTTNMDVFMGKYGSCAAAPTGISAINGGTLQCTGATAIYSVAPVSGANNYAWTLPGGWTGTSTSNTISATIGSASGTITVGASNSCGTSSLQALTVQVNPVPAQPSAISGAVSFCNGAGAQTYSIATVSGASSYSWSLPGGWTGSSTSNTIQVTPNATSGVISVAAISSCGTGPARNLSITVNALPSVAISGTNAICTGNSTNLNASGASTYTWNTGSNNSSISVSPTANTTYTVTGTDANGCVNTALKTITVNTLPSVAISGASAICTGNSTNLNASGASTYTWNTGSNNSSISVNPTANATYTVTGTDANGCTNTALKNITVNTLPSVAINGANVICSGNSANLSASGANTYTWSTGSNNSSISVNPTANATYTVTGTDANGCENTATSSIVVNALPSVAINGANAICTGNSANLNASGANTYTWSTGSNNSSISVSPTTNTTYTVTGTDVNGCENTATSSIAVNALPSVAINGANAICTGNSTNLNASGASTYTWNTGSNNSSISVSPTANTTYTVTGTDANGCENTATSSIVVNALPSVNISATSTLICSGETATLTASGASTYTWSTGTTGVTETVSPASDNTYTLSGTDMNGCSQDAVSTISVSLCTGVESFNNETTTISLYPNPVGNELNISSTDVIRSIQITDVTGKTVHVISGLDVVNTTIDMKNYSSGIYVVTIHTNKRTKHIKLVKE